MSKYRKIAVKFLNEAALVQALEDACQQFGIHYEHHPVGANLIGWLGDARAEKAQYVIRRRYVGGAANDMGFAREADGSFTAIISDFDSRHDGQVNLDYLTQRYAYHQVVNEAEAQGYTVYEQYQPDGSIELALERAW